MFQPATAAVRFLSGEREPVRVATTEGIALDGLQTVDGIQLDVNDRVLVKDQSDTRVNGIYTASVGIWRRAPDANFGRAVANGVTVKVQEGASNAGKSWMFTASNPTVGADPITLEFYLDASFAEDIAAALADLEGVENAVEAVALALNTKLNASTFSAFTATRGQANGFAGLGADGKVPSSQLPPKVMVSLSPFDYGGVGDGVADDTAAVNQVFAVARALAAASQGSANGWRTMVPISIDLSGGRWRITGNGINATGIAAWNLEIRGGLLVGECTGKTILDLVGTRGFSLNGVAFYGDKTNRPSCAYQLARPTPGGFCDNCSFYEVSTTGWFSRTAIHAYAHETALHSHCTYFNYDHTAFVAIFEGFDAHPFTSMFTTVMSGGTSFINNKVDNCDFRYLPIGDNYAAITGLTIGTNPTVTMSAGHSFQNGETVCFAGVGGQSALQRFTATVASRTATTFVAQGVTTTGSYTGGGGVIRAQTKPSVYLARSEDFNFDSSYIVAYGQPHIQLGFPDTANAFNRLVDIQLDLLYEGSGNSCNIAFETGDQAVVVEGLTVLAYSSVARDAVMGVSNGANSKLTIVDLKFSSHHQLGPAVMVSPENKCAFYGVDVTVPYVESCVVSSFQAFAGRVLTVVNGVLTDYGVSGGTAVTAPTAFTPSVSSSSGSYTSLTATGSYYTVGPLVFIEVVVNVTNGGTANGAMVVQLPIAAGRQSTLVGRETGVSGDILSAHIGPAALGQMSIVKDDNQPPNSTTSGTVVRVSGVYSRV